MDDESPEQLVIDDDYKQYILTFLMNLLGSSIIDENDNKQNDTKWYKLPVCIKHKMKWTRERRMIVEM